MIQTIKDTTMMNKLLDSTQCKQIDAENKIILNRGNNSVVPEQVAADDNVSVRSISKQLEALKAMLQDAPEINTARVTYFKAEINAGTYQIDSQAISNKMLQSMELA